MKKAGILFMGCFGLLLLSTIISMNYSTRNPYKLIKFQKNIMLLNLVAFGAGLAGGFMVYNQHKDEN